MSSVKNYEKFNYCQYLYVATQNLLRAISLFNSSATGDVERSFSALHKSWGHLFQADVLMNDNGYIYYCSACKAKDCIKDYKTSGHTKYLIGIEQALNDVKGWTKAGLIPKSKDYEFIRGTGLFKTLNEKKNFYQNLSIIRELRNIDQHDYFEANPDIFTDLMDTMRPYVISNVKNFLETYKDFFVNRKICRSDRSQYHCSCKKILSPEKLASQIYFPVSYNNIVSSIGMNETLYSVISLEEKTKNIEEAILATDKTILALEKANGALELQLQTNKKVNIQKVQTNIINNKDEIQKELEVKNDLAIQLFNLEKNEVLTERSITFRSSAIRKAFQDAKSIYGKNLEDDGRLLMNIPTDPEYLKEKPSKPKTIIAVKSHLENFQYKNILEVKLVLDEDPEFPYEITRQKIKVFWEEMEDGNLNRNEEYFGRYFGEVRYTRKFLEYIKKNYIGLPKPSRPMIAEDDSCPF